MKMRVIVPALLCIVMTVCSVTSAWGEASGSGNDPEEPLRKIKLFDETAEALYIAAKQSNRQSGYLQVQQLRQLIRAHELSGLLGRPEGWDALESSAVQVERAIASGNPSADWLSGASRIRLAADALYRPEMPLWHQYNTVMQDDLARVRKAWSRHDGGGAESARAAIDSFAAHLDRIEAAARMQADPAKITEVKERLNYTIDLLEASKRSYAQDAWTGDSIAQLGDAVDRLFEGTLTAIPAIAPIQSARPVSWSLLIGAIIMGVLAYSGYRKYKQQPYGVKPFK